LHGNKENDYYGKSGADNCWNNSMYLANDNSNKHGREDNNGKDLTYYHDLPESENNQKPCYYNTSFLLCKGAKEIFPPEYWLWI